jgi:hypothetical protein
MHVSKLLTAQAIPAADLAALEAAKTKIAGFSEISRRCGKDWYPINFSVRSWWHSEVDRLSEALGTAPTLELADQLHEAIFRCKEAETSAPVIDQCLTVAAARESASLAPLAAGICDRAEALLDSQASEARQHAAEAARSPMASGREVAEVESRIADLRGQLEAHRGQAAGDPFSWILENGFAQPDPTEPTAKPAAAPIKSFRGPVKLSKPEPAPVADNDVLSILAELENG